ncbi:MAG: AAA family ATPase [Gemmataceae bacterium]
MSLEKSRPVALDLTQMKQRSDGVVRWLWQGYIAFGSITLCTSRWKSGKTTLLSVLLARMGAGGTLAGSPVAAAHAVVVSEEGPQIWVARDQSLGIGNHVRWFCQPFLHVPKRHEWIDLLNEVAKSIARRPTLIVIDPLAAVLPNGDENNAAAIVRALAPLRKFTKKGSAVLLLHHPRKGTAFEPRGSGALLGFADILMELELPAHFPQQSRRRSLRARGRHADIPGERLIELALDGRDYQVCDLAAEECAERWEVIRWVLADANKKMTRDEILKNWPETRLKPHRVTLWEWLEAAHQNGSLARSGRGQRNDPFRYWLPEREPYFLPELPPLEPLDLGARIEDDLAFARKVLDGEKRR